MVQIHQERCIGCGLCAKDCIAVNIQITEGKARVLGECLACGHCVAICPQYAVSIPEFDMADITDIGTALQADALLQVIKSRRSIRDYRAEKIEQEKLERLAQAGRYTATAKNTQGCRFVFVQDELESFKAMIWEAVEKAVETNYLPPEVAPAMMDNYKRFLKLRQQTPSIDYLFRNAPAVLFIGANTPVDAGLAAQNIELMATAQGLGVLYNGFLNYTIELTAELKQWLGLADKKSYVCMLLGYPAVQYKRTAPHKPADSIWR